MNFETVDLAYEETPSFHGFQNMRLNAGILERQPQAILFVVVLVDAFPASEPCKDFSHMRIRVRVNICEELAG